MKQLAFLLSLLLLLCSCTADPALPDYKAVIENTAAAINSYSGDPVFLKEYLTSDLGERITAFSLTDLSGDGIPETVLQAVIGESVSRFIILYEADGTLHMSSQPLRGMNDLKADGTFSFSGGIYNHGSGRMHFNGGKCEMIREVYCEGSSDDTQVFHIGEQSVTAEEFSLALQAQSRKPDAVWETYSVENFAAVLDSLLVCQ